MNKSSKRYKQSYKKTKKTKQFYKKSKRTKQSYKKSKRNMKRKTKQKTKRQTKRQTINKKGGLIVNPWVIGAAAGVGAVGLRKLYKYRKEGKFEKGPTYTNLGGGK